MERYLNSMKRAGLLASIAFEDMERFLRGGSFKIVEYGKNNILHFAGDVCSKLEVILSGNVVIERIDESGNFMTIAEIPSDGILGGNLLFSKFPYYPMTITTKKPAVVLEIDKERLHQLLSDNHEFLMRYLQEISDNTVILGNIIKHSVKKTIRESLTSYLAYECHKQQSNTIKLNMTKKALAERIGVSRTSLSRELAKMRDDGLIRFDVGSVELLPGFRSNRQDLSP